MIEKNLALLMSLSEKRQGKNAQMLKYVNKFTFKKKTNSYAFRLISHVTCSFKLFLFHHIMSF